MTTLRRVLITAAAALGAVAGLYLCFLIISNMVFSGSITGSTKCPEAYIAVFNKAYEAKNPQICYEYTGPAVAYKQWKGGYLCTIPSNAFHNELDIDGSSGDTCVKEVAIHSKDWKLCNYVADLRLREGCMRLSTRNFTLEYCSAFSRPTDRSTCFRAMAAEGNNLTLCYAIEDPAYKDLCTWDIALKRNNSTICNYVVDPNYQLRCQGQLS